MAEPCPYCRQGWDEELGELCKECRGIKIYFNPFAFTIEENNEFLARGYEVMPIEIPRVKNERRT